jgi:hypothetical protein
MPQVGVDSQGDVVVAWLQAATTSGPYSLWTCYYSATAKAWSTPASPMVGTVGVSPNFSLAMTDAGAQLAWSESTDGVTYQIYTTRWSPNTTGSANPWSTQAQVAASGVMCDQPTVGIDAQGNALLVWGQALANATSYVNLYSSYYAKSSGSWTTPAGISNATGTVVQAPHLSMNSSGSAALVALLYDGANWRVISSLFNGGWGSAGFIQTATGGSAANPYVYMGSGGTILAVWNQPDASGIQHPYANVYLQ